MKWAIPQLLKMSNQSIEIEEFVNFEDIVQRTSELRDLSDVKISGTAEVEYPKRCHFHIRISGTMTLGCAKTLKDVEYPFEIDTVESFTLDSHEKTDDFHKPVGQTIDITPIVWQNIIMEIPLRIYHEDAKEATYNQGDGWQVLSENEYVEHKAKVEDEEKEEEPINPKFAKLLELFDEEE
jgi:uncharacterized protein